MVREECSYMRNGSRREIQKVYVGALVQRVELLCESSCV